MFEGIISDLLVKYLGQYLKDFNKENLRIGIFGGDVLLQNLEIKEDALNQINVPFSIKRGVLGKLKIKVPWKNLKSQPVVVLIDNVYLIAQPDYSFAEYDDAKEQATQLKLKKERLAQAEALKSFNYEDEESKKSSSFVQRLVTKIVDNLQVEINKVHIRFEDSTNKEYPFAAGVCIDNLRMQSCDKDWKEMFVENRPDSLIYKLAKLGNLSIYFDHLKEQKLSNMSIPDFIQAMDSLIPKKSIDTLLNFVLKPMNAQLKATINTSDLPDKKIPKLTASLLLDDVSFEIEDIMFHSLIKLSDSLVAYAKVKDHLKFRPKIDIKSKGGAKLWWKYAIDATLEKVRVKLNSKTWKFLSERRKTRKEYISLYKRKIGEKEKAKWLKSLSKSELAELEKIEDQCPYEDTIFFRSIAEVEYKKESKNYATAQEEKKKEQEKKSFFSRVFGGSSSSNEPQTPLLSQQEREELYRTIDFKEVLEKVELPKDYVRVKMGVEIQSTSLALIHNTRDSRLTLIYSLLSLVKTEVLVRTDSVKVDLSMKDFRVDDKFTQNTAFPSIIYRSGHDIGKDLLNFAFELNPLDGHADVAMNVDMHQVDIIVIKPTLERIGKFFIPEDQSETISAVKNRAAKEMSALSQKTKAQLEDALKNHKTIDMNVYFDAPFILIPEDPTNRDSLMLVADLGSLTVKSEVQEKSNLISSGKRKEENYYDRFHLSLQHLKVLIGRLDAKQQWREEKFQVENNLQLVEDFAIKILFQNCIQPNEITLTKMKVSGELPCFSVNFSPKKLGMILKIVKSITNDAPQANIQTTKKISNNQTVGTTPVVVLEEKEIQELTQEDKLTLSGRKNIEASFEIKEIVVNIHQNTPNSEVLLAKLRVKELGVKFVQRTFDMEASARLGGFFIEDHIRPNSKYIATSTLSDTNEDLIVISFRQCSQEHPQYPGELMRINASFNQLFLILNGDTITTLLRFGMEDVLKELEVMQEPAKQQNNNSQKVVASAKPKNKQNATNINNNSNVSLAVKASLKKVQFIVVLPSQNEKAEPNSFDKFASFDINVVEASFTQFEDSGMEARFSLDSLILSDARPSTTNLFKQLLFTEKLTENTKQIELKYVRSAVGDQNINVDLRRPSVVFVPEIVFGLQDFFLNIVQSINPISQKPIDQPLSKEQAKVTNDVKPVQTPGGNILAVINIVEPSITLVHEDAKIDTQALIVKTSLNVEFSRTISKLNGQTDITDNARVSVITFQAFMSRPLVKNDAPLPIIKPFDINLIYNGKNDIQQDIDIKLQPIAVFISYQDFKMTTSIIEKVKSRIPATKPKAIPNNPENPTQEQPIAQVAVKKSEKLVVSCSSIGFTLINDYQGRNIPLTEFRTTDIKVKMLNWSSDLHADVAIQIVADYFNNSIVKFEPLIEHWCGFIELKKTNNPKLQVTVKSTDLLNINVSHALIDTLGNILEIVNKDYYQSSQIQLSDDYSPYWIINETGSNLIIKTEEGTRELAPGSRNALNFGKEKKSVKSDPRVQNERTLSFSLDSVNFINNISIDMVQETVTIVSFKGLKIKVVCEVKLVDGSKEIKIRSLVLVKNRTSLPLEIGLVNNSIEKEKVAVIATQPGSETSLPPEFCENSFIGVRIIGDYQWADRSSWIMMADVREFLEKKVSKIQKNNKTKLSKTRYEACYHCDPTSTGTGRRVNIVLTIGIEEVKGHAQLVMNFAPPFVLENMLPVSFRTTIGETLAISTGEISSGNSYEIYEIDPKKDVKFALSVPGYQESKVELVSIPVDKKIKGKVFRRKSDKLAEKLIITDQKKKELTLRIDNRIQEFTRRVSIFAPYWIINRTNLKLSYRPSVIGTGKDEPVFDDEVRDANGESKPVMFSFGKIDDVFGGKLVVKGTGTKWSKPFSIDEVGTKGMVTLVEEKKDHESQIGVDLYLAAGDFQRTRIVEFDRSFVFVNEMSRDIHLKQVGTNEITKLKPSESFPFYKWSKGKGTTKKVSINLDPNTHNWSGAFPIDQLADFCLCLRPLKPEPHVAIKPPYLARLEISQESITTFIRIKDEDKQNPPYKIENDTSLDVVAYQKEFEKSLEKYFSVPTKTTTSFAWEELTKPHKVVLFFQGSAKPDAEYAMDSIEPFKPIKIKGITINAYVRAESSTRTLVLTENEMKYKRESFTESEKEYKQRIVDVYDIKLEVQLKGIGVSVLDKTPQEMIYLLISDISLSFGRTPSDEMIELKIKNFQIDNQLQDTTMPVLLYHVAKDPEKPFFHLSRTKSLETNSIDFYRYFSILMQEINVSIEDLFLNTILDFIKSLQIERLTVKPGGPPRPQYAPTITLGEASDAIRTDPNTGIKFPKGVYYFTYAFHPGGKMGPITRFEANTQFNKITFTNLQPLRGYSKILYISTDGKNFQKIDTISTRNRNDVSLRYKTTFNEFSEKSELKVYDTQETINVVKSTEERKMYLLYFVLNPIKLNATFTSMPGSTPETGPLRVALQVLGSTFANLDHAPIKLNALILEHAFVGYSQLSQRIMKHYTRQVITEVYKILGSADFLGNPVGLFSNIGTGVMDFFYEPAQGLIKSPEAFGKGLAKGTASLLKNSIYGTFNTVSKLTGTVGKGLATITLDDEYIKKRQIKQATERPKHVGEGLLLGAKEFGLGFVEGFKGVVEQPIKGGQKEGAKGVFKGIGKGLIGLAVKPIVGSVDLISRTTEGIRNTTTILDKNAERSRAPRSIGEDKTLSEYSESDSKGVFLLYSISEGAYRKEVYKYHEELEDENTLLITNKRLIMVNTMSESWNVLLKGVTDVELVKMGILVKFDYEPFNAIISCDDQGKNMRLYTKITSCVKAYKENRKGLKNKIPFLNSKDGKQEM